MARLVVFADGEEDEDPQLTALSSELEQKALKSAELVCLFNHSWLYNFIPNECTGKRVEQTKPKRF